MVREVYRDRLGIDLPEHGDVSADYVAAVATLRFGDRTRVAEAQRRVMEAFAAGQASECWQDVPINPQPYDVVRMGGRGLNRSRVIHVGVVVDHHRMLHIEKSTGSVVVPLTHPTVAGRIIGYSRHAQCNKS